MFEKRTYVRRRKLLKKQVGSGLVLFPGNDESPMNYTANAYPFRQDSSFLYFFGLTAPGSPRSSTSTPTGRCLFGDDIGLEDIIWMGPQPPLEGPGRSRSASGRRPRARSSARSSAPPSRKSGRSIICLLTGPT